MSASSEGRTRSLGCDHRHPGPEVGEEVGPLQTEPAGPGHDDLVGDPVQRHGLDVGEHRPARHRGCSGTEEVAPVATTTGMPSKTLPSHSTRSGRREPQERR